LSRTIAKDFDVDIPRTSEEWKPEWTETRR